MAWNLAGWDLGNRSEIPMLRKEVMAGHLGPYLDPVWTLFGATGDRRPAQSVSALIELKHAAFGGNGSVWAK